MDFAAQHASFMNHKWFRERDVQPSGNRDRGKSYNGPQAVPPVASPSMTGGTGYPIHPSQLVETINMLVSMIRPALPIIPLQRVATA